MSEFSKRVLGPVAIPLGAAVFIGVLVFAMSRILLAVPEMGSNSIALLISAEILGIGGVVASTARLRPTQKAVLYITGLAIIGGGAASAQIGVREIEAHSEEITIVAANIAFDLDTLEFPADEPVALKLSNQDPNVPHNVGIYDEAFTEAVFVGEVFNGPGSKVYDIEPLEEGTYGFRCDVHPQQMTGTLVVGEGTGEGPHTEPEPTASAMPDHGETGEPAPEAAAEADIVAESFAFDTDTLTLLAGREVTIHFENADDGVPHNVAIYTDQSATEEIYKGEIISGPDHAEYTFDAPPPGEYFFRCDVHPNMSGTAAFE